MAGIQILNAQLSPTGYNQHANFSLPAFSVDCTKNGLFFLCLSSIPNVTDQQNGSKDEVNGLLFGLLFVSVGLLGVCGNCLVIVAIASDCKMRKSAMNVLLANLATADLANLMVCTPDIAVRLGLSYGRVGHWFLPDFACPLVRYLQIACLYTSLLTQLAVCIERYFAIASPFKVGIFCTRRKVLVWALVLWIIALSSALPYFFYHGVIRPQVEHPFAGPQGTGPGRTAARNESTDNVLRICIWKPMDKFSFYFKCVECASYYFLPLILITVLYARVSFILWTKHRGLFFSPGDISSHRSTSSPVQSSRRPSLSLDLSRVKLTGNRSKSVSFGTFQQQQQNHLQVTFGSSGQEPLKGRKSVVKMLMACVFVYFVCYSPIQVIFLAEAFRKSFEFSFTVRLLLNCLTFTCSAANPLLYTVFSQKFRRRFAQLAHCKLNGSKDNSQAARSISKRPQPTENEHPRRCVSEMHDLNKFGTKFRPPMQNFHKGKFH